MNNTTDRILIIDFGSQYTQLIARRVREAGVYSEVLPYDTEAEKIQAFKASGIILSGGPESVTEDNSPRAPDLVFTLGIPVLGICYGMQTMATQLGGQTESSHNKEFGAAKIKQTATSALFADCDSSIEMDVWMSHGDKVTRLPPNFQTIGSSSSTAIAAMSDEAQKFYALQFHPEVTHTKAGEIILNNFIHTICACQSNWNQAAIIEASIKEIRETVGQDTVILGLSGGVDSSVAATLLHQAIGDQLICVFVDTGLLRLNEGAQVMEIFEKQKHIHIIHVEAETEFLEKLKGIADPEEKRKIIGATFVKIFEREAAKIKNAKWLAQGTIYSDVIESAGNKNGKAKVIKSHHNVGGLPADMQLKLIEPLRHLFKDEVRKMGVALGLPHNMVYRHPFPGPGLGVRILGEVRKEFADILRKADAIFIEELIAQDWYNKVSQAFAVFLPVKSVGVVGDGRQYEYIIALRAVQTIDFMTAHWAHLPYELLQKVSTRIINEVRGVSRVTYDISDKPPATIEWE
jgi:GMP synthase (glutamine-hydrolysing)